MSSTSNIKLRLKKKAESKSKIGLFDAKTVIFKKRAISSTQVPHGTNKSTFVEPPAPRSSFFLPFILLIAKCRYLPFITLSINTYALYA